MLFRPVHPSIFPSQRLPRAARSDGGLAPPHVAGLRYAWAGKLDDLGEARLAQVLPLDPLMVL